MAGASGSQCVSSTAVLQFVKFLNLQLLDDTIQVSAAGFGGGLVAGAAITAAQFVIGSTSVDTSNRFIYNSVTGGLFFDQDGSGSGIAQIQLAQLSKGLALTNADIVVVA